MSITERSATAGVKFSTTILRAIGIVTLGTIFSIPNACFSEPATCLNLGTSVSAKLNSKTKNAINSVAISAKVAIQAGAPPPGHFGQSSLGSSGGGGPGGGRFSSTVSSSESPASASELSGSDESPASFDSADSVNSADSAPISPSVSPATSEDSAAGASFPSPLAPSSDSDWSAPSSSLSLRFRSAGSATA